MAKRAGTAGVVLEGVLTIVVIAEAPAAQRGEVASKQVGGIVGSLSFGAAGAWAGATTFALAGSPTLAIPVVGEVTEGTLILTAAS